MGEPNEDYEIALNNLRNVCNDMNDPTFWCQECGVNLADLVLVLDWIQKPNFVTDTRPPRGDDIHRSTGKISPEAEFHIPVWSPWFLSSVLDGGDPKRMCMHPDCDIYELDPAPWGEDATDV